MKFEEQKHNNQKISWLLSSIVVVLMLGIGIIVVAAYPTIKNMTNSMEFSIGNYNNMERIGNANFSLYYKLMLQEMTEDEALATLLDLSKVDTEYKASTKENFYKDLTKFNERLKSNYPNLLYYVTDGTRELSNNELLKQYVDMESPDLDNYLIYVKVSYDKNGVVTVNEVKGLSQYDVKNFLDEFINRGYGYLQYEKKETVSSSSDSKKYYNEDMTSMPMGEAEYYSYGYSPDNFIQNPKGVTYVYAVKNHMDYQDSYYYDYQAIYYEYCSTLVVLVLVAGMAVVALIALLIPYSREKQMYVMRHLLMIPIEVVLVAGVFVAFVISMIVFRFIPLTIFNMLTEDLRSFVMMDTQQASFLVSMANVIIIALILYCAFYLIVFLKNWFAVGFFKYLAEKSMVITVVRNIVRFIKRTIHTLSSFDLTSRDKRKLLFLVVINGIITIVLCCFFVFGIPFAIIYHVILFIYVYRKLNTAREQYQSLLKVTGSIAEGRLDETIDEHLGMFEPFKEEIGKIQSGFKKAVEEEVKSQNMKTELISNVSHDLKTPLTAIITYVDLLKDETITEEQRKEFIDILDRKSQRLKVLIEDLFEMSKATSRNINLNYIQLDIGWLLKEVLLELEEKIGDANLIVKATYPEEKVMVTLDSQRTYRILENLIINITKYAMPHSRVYIALTTSNQQAMITMKNISADEINYEGSDLMERFVRGDQSRNTEGSGLGLAIAKSLTEAQGGTMEIEVDGDLFKVILSFPVGNRGELVHTVTTEFCEGMDEV